LEEGRLALGAWGESLRAKLRTLLRAGGPEGRAVEWGSFRVEERMPLFGSTMGRGGSRMPPVGGIGMPKPAGGGVVSGRLRVVASSGGAGQGVGVKLPAPVVQPFLGKGAGDPGSPLELEGPWKGLYEALGFEQALSGAVGRRPSGWATTTGRGW